MWLTNTIFANTYETEISKWEILEDRHIIVFDYLVENDLHVFLYRKFGITNSKSNSFP